MTTLPTEYQEYLDQALTSLERWTDDAMGLDERMDYANILLTNILLALGGTVPGSELPEAMTSLKESIDAWVAALGINRTDFSTGQKTVTTAGSPVQLPDVRIPNGHTLRLTAMPSNADDIFLSHEEATAGPTSTSRYSALKPGDPLDVRLDNLNRIWIDATTADDGVSWYVELE